MSTLQIRKLESGTFKNVDSIDGEFFLGRFNFKQELTKAFLVEAYGAKRREYVIEDISVYDYLGAEELFTNFTDLENRLTELGYTGIETNGIIPTASSYISSDVDNAIELGSDLKLFANIGGGGSSEIILNYQSGTAISLGTTERVASTTGINAVSFSENVTKSGSLLTGPFYMLTQNVTKTGTISKLRYRYFPDSTDLSIELRVYAFKQNKDSTSIYDCRLLLEETLTATTAYTVQKFEFLTADFLDANMIDGEFLVITCKKVGAASYTLLSQNLTIIY